jgi:2-C-methyl-D-erythritol 4-phosphate cytidylyltransferase
MADFHVIIPAAGTGSRMQADIPKQYLPLCGKTVIQHTLAVFSRNARISSITLVLNSEDTIWDSLNEDSIRNLHVQRCGGATRADTVLNGLQSLQHKVNADAWILVHDAARPGLSTGALDRLLDELEHDAVGGLLAVPLADTLKRADAEQRISGTESRDALWQAQTPQMFRYGLLNRALQDTNESNMAPTDEAQAIERLGLRPKLVQGELRNLKMTYTQDLALLEAILSTDKDNKDETA